MRQLAKLWGKGEKWEKVIHYYLYGCLVGDVQRQHSEGHNQYSLTSKP
jgi:hypothetical protein